MIKNLKWLLWLLPFLFLAPGWAANEKEVSSDIIELVKSKQNQAAFDLAQANVLEFEGQPRFDFAYGLAARANGYYHRAVFAFERVIFAVPTNLDARFALATAYYQVGNYSASKTQFEKLLGLDISQQVRATSQDYLNAIDRQLNSRKSRLAGSVQLGFGNDDNANNGVEDEFIDIPLIGQVLLFDESRQVESVYYDLNATLSYLSPISKTSTWYVSTNLNHVQFEDPIATSRTFLSASLGYSKTFSHFSTNTSVFYRPLWLEEEKFLDYFGVSANLTVPVNSHVQVGIDASYAIERYDQNEALDKDQIALNPFVQYVGKRSSHKLSIRYAIDSGEVEVNDLVSRDLYGVGYRWLHQISAKWLGTLSTEYLEADYDDINPLFELFRDDEQFRFDLGLDYLTADAWKWKVRFSHIDNSSTVSIFDYQRNKIWLGVEYVF